MALGCAPIGNLGRRIDEGVAIQTIEAAWDAGVRYFDVAPHYGLGLAETRLGKALAHHARDEFIVSTKVGRVLEEVGEPGQDDEGFAVVSNLRRRRDYTRDGVLRSIEDSLVRLGMDRLDIVFVHDPDDYFDDAVTQAFPALEELRDQGVIRSYGAGMNQAPMLQKFLEQTQADVLMCAGRYTLMDRSAEELLRLAEEQNVSIVAAGVFNSGLLARDVVPPAATFDYRQATPAELAEAEHIGDLCRSFGTSLPRAAAQFPLRRSAISTICLGARSPDQVQRNASLFDSPVPSGLWDALDSVSAGRDSSASTATDC